MLLPRLQRHVFTCWVITTNELLIAFKELDSALFLPNTNQHFKCYFRYRLVICDSRVDNFRSQVHLSTIAQIIQHVYVKPFTLKFKNQLFVCIKYDFLIFIRLFSDYYSYLYPKMLLNYDYHQWRIWHLHWGRVEEKRPNYYNFTPQ